MLITGFDTETTGLKQEDGHRIIEIALLTYDLDSRQLVDTYIQRINPERAIDPKAQAVHGISYEELVGQPTWEQVADTVQSKLSATNLVVAHNLAFDMPFVTNELARISRQVPTTGGFCTMENGRWATYDGKAPKLGELCYALDVPYDPTAAHSASYDVEVMMACFFKCVERGIFQMT